MFIKTRTTATEVLADLFREVNRQASRASNSAHNRRAHPTYMSKPALREMLAWMEGAYELAMMVANYEQIPEWLTERVEAARVTVREELDRN